MATSGIAASAKWRGKTLDVSAPSVNVSGSGGGVVPSSASSVTSMRTTQTMPMTVKQLNSMPLGSSASITSRTSMTSQGPSLSTASAKWRSKWPTAPNKAPALATAKAAAPAIVEAAEEPNAATPGQDTSAQVQDSAGPPQSQEAVAASVVAVTPAPAAETPASGEPTAAPLEQPPAEHVSAAQPIAAPGTEISAPEAEPVAIESNEPPATGAVVPTTEPGSELPAEASSPTPIVSQSAEQPATPVSQEVVATQEEQVEPAKPAESELPAPVVNIAPPEPNESSAAAAPDVPAPAASRASTASEPAPEPQNSAEGPESAKPPVTAVEAPQTPEAAQPVMQESPPAPAPAATAKVEEGTARTTGEAAAVDAKTGALKVALLNFDEVGAPLADKDEIDQVFKWRKLEPVWVDELESFPQDASVLVTTGTRVGSELLAKAPDLKLVAVASDGYDNVDVDACKTRGIAVVNVPGCSTDAAAELAMGFVLAHLRNLAASQKTLDQGFWTCPSQEKLSSKTVGLLGVGSLGLRLAELFHAFGVKSLLGHSPAQTDAFTELGGTYSDSLEDLFRRSDVVCICCSFSSETQGLVSEALLELLRPNSVLVNVAHGGIIDEDALGRLLAKNRFRAGLDVFQTEPLPKNSTLRDVPAETLLATPHVGYQTVECLEKRFDTTVKNILAFQLDQAINRVA